MHVQQLFQWRKYRVGGPRTLCLDHMLEKVKKAWFTSDKRLSYGGIATLQMQTVIYDDTLFRGLSPSLFKKCERAACSRL